MAKRLVQEAVDELMGEQHQFLAGTKLGIRQAGEELRHAVRILGDARRSIRQRFPATTQRDQLDAQLELASGRVWEAIALLEPAIPVR